MASLKNIHLLEDIQKDVRIILDQNQVEAGVLETNRDTLELDEIIEQKVVHAARQILESAPLWMVSDDTVENGYDSFVQPMTQSYQEHEPQTLARTSDFLRPINFMVYDVNDQEQLTDPKWDVPVHTFMGTDTDAYRAAKSAYSGIKPNPKRPAVFYNQQTNMFELFGCASGAPQLKCILLPSIVKLDYSDNVLEHPYIAFPDILYEALLYQTASLVETAYKNAQAAQMYSSIARGFMGIDEPETTTKQSQNQK